jgi:hypothetical protein
VKNKGIHMSSVIRKCRVNACWHYALAIVAVVTCGLALSVPASAAATALARAATAAAVEVCGEGPALVRPASMILTCADDGERAAGLHWASWSATTAHATGRVTWRACTSLCADSRRQDSTSADFTLADPVRVPGKGVLFTRLELHVTGPAPRGFLRTVAFDESPVAGPAPRPSHRRARGLVVAPSGNLGYAQIEGYWLYAGGPDGAAGTYTDAEVAAAITGAESSSLPGIIQSGVDYCGAGADRAGWGLWQITCGNSVPAEYGSDFQLLDPWNNAEGAVWKCEQDVDAGDNCFAPWSTYTDGAYESYLQHTPPDMSISDPGEYVQINPTPPGTPASPPPDPGSTYGPGMPNQAVPSPLGGAPVVADPETGNVEVYARGTRGTLEADAYLHGPWSGWENLHGTIAGTPSAIFDPETGNLEVYARGKRGTLEADAYLHGPWSGWQNLHGSITGNPAPVYDTETGNLEVYARGKHGTLEADAYLHGHWSGWQSLGGSITGSPAVINDPQTGNLEVYATGRRGTLEADAYLHGHWSGWQNLHGSITGTPRPVYDPETGNLEVYATGRRGALEADAFLGSHWSGWESLGGSITGSPAPVYDTDTGNLEVYATGTGKTLEADAYLHGSWSGWKNLGGSITTP